MIRKLLVANRGEIAVRVIRAAREMGIVTVAVASDADRSALHVRVADEVVMLGDSEPAASYLDVQKILNAARSTGADVVHPGYGFLSERASFSEACREAGISFIGPSPEAMRALGSKIEAKQLAIEAGVPVTPGLFKPGASQAELKLAASEIGYPVLLKASAGGGGRGMRIVRDASAFDSEFSIAADEAENAFGDGAMMVEKLVERPRHIEVQFLADSHGQIALLFERECSLQRRHQKLLEESPSPLGERMDVLWPRLRTATEALARSSGYVGAGTAEFMLDPKSGEFYFLEVNARLQVEHPVTEAITGLDLVQWQLRIASGERLTLPSDLMAANRAAIRGHAIEVRLVAEDPGQNFLPSTGKILAWAEPKAPGVRVDTGFGPGAEVSRYYDSLIAKVIVHAETRASAVDRLEAALLDFHILGVKTNIGYLLDVLGHEKFRAGEIDTGFLGREMSEWSPPKPPDELMDIATRASTGSHVRTTQFKPSTWQENDGFRIGRLP